MPRAVGLAGGEAGQGLRAGASRARHWLPYGFRSGGWAGERPAPGLGASLSPGTRFLCVAGCAVPVGDAASFPPRAARVPELGGCFPRGGRAAATGFSVAGAADAGREGRQFPVPSGDMASKSGAGTGWVPAPACLGRQPGGQGGRRESWGWQQRKDSLGGQGKCHGKC